MRNPRFIFALALAAAALSPALLRAQTPPVRLVLFTHIEDNTPAGTLPSPESRQNYLLYRSKLITMANLAVSYSVPWSLQPDWKFLRAALLYEDAALMQTTNNKNLLRYLKEDLGVPVDPHSHEAYGYNYTDVAHLLDSLGVGATTVIGGHIWDPDLPQFQEWDRFRVPVPGDRYPWALWRGDILMGSGTPNHVNDPVVSGVWRPQDRYHYFVHDSTANIAAIGQYRGTIEDIPELLDLYRTGAVSTNFMLTSSYHITPSMILAAGGIGNIENSVFRPVAAMRDSGWVAATDFTSLIEDWQTSFGSRGFIYDAGAPVGIGSPEPGTAEKESPVAPVSLNACVPNPFAARTLIQYSLDSTAGVRLAIFDAAGREVALLVNRVQPSGRYTVPWQADGIAGGVYFCRIQGQNAQGEPLQTAAAGKLILLTR